MKKMKLKPSEAICGLYPILVGAALLLLSAVAENGETETSRALVANRGDIPAMIASLLAGMAILTGGSAASFCLERYYT